jgi:type IV pilus assembly protein PilA
LFLDSTKVLVLPIKAHENAFQRGKGGVVMLKALYKRTQDDKGFTLIELMVVVLIIAILIAIAIPTFLGMRRRAQDRAAQSNLRNALTAAKAFYTDDETFVGFDSDLVVDNPDVNAAEGAADIEPSLAWNTAPASTQNVVSIRNLGTRTVALSTLSASGTIFCIADTNGQTGEGTGEQATAAACAGAADW